MGRFFYQPSRSDLQVDGSRCQHLEHEVSRFEKMLEGITRVLARGES